MTYCKTLELQLTTFRESYHSVRCLVGSDNLVYRCTRGYSDKAALVANCLIEKLGLDLVAVSTNLHTKDSYTIQSIFSE